MKTNIIHQNYTERNLALVFKKSNSYKFAFSKTDQKNVKKIVDFIKNNKFEAYLSGEVAKNVLINKLPSRNYKNPSYKVPYDTISIIAVPENAKKKRASDLSDKICELLYEKPYYKMNKDTKKKFGKKIIKIDPTLKMSIGKNISDYSFLFSWDDDTIFFNFLNKDIILGIYNKIN